MARRRAARDVLTEPDLPVLDESRCTGCGDCPEVCPTNCLAMAGPIPWLPRPGDCISCSLCVWICPSDALRLQAPSDE